MNGQKGLLSKLFGFGTGYEIWKPNRLRHFVKKNLKKVIIMYNAALKLCYIIRPDFKRLGVWLSDPIKNPDHLQTNLLLTI